MSEAFSVVGEAPRPERIQAVAFFDEDGRIHHMHHVITLEGARPQNDEAVMEEARALAEKADVDIGALQTLRVKDMANPHRMHRVDVEKKVLVEIEPPSLLAAARKG